MKRVCVTGAGGYIGSWVVKLLLSKGYIVHGTVRDPCDETKNGHLKKLENAEERLHLFKADMLDYESLCAAFAGCSGVLHVASPVPLIAFTAPGSRIPNPQVEQLDPAILGTQNVLNACSKAKVQKVVVVSSVAAIMMNPEWTLEMELDESCWTDIEYAKSTRDWYVVSKTIAEMEALNFAKQHDVTVVTICPSLVIGPMLQSIVNATAVLGVPVSYKSYHFIGQSGFPSLNSGKLLKLGRNYRPLEETIVDTIKNSEEIGLLEKGKLFPSTITF